MLYFNLMSAINLYVAVDWQGDREIERAGERLQREPGSAEGVRVRGGGAKAEKERNPELWWTKREEGWKEAVQEEKREGGK